MNSSKVTKGVVLAAIKNAMAEALISKKGVKIALPGFEGHTLTVREGRMYKVQQHLSKFITLKNDHTNCIAWSCQAGELGNIISLVMNRYKEVGVLLPVDSTCIPTGHPAFNFGATT